MTGRLVRQVLTLVHKELLIEWRQAGRVSALFFFGTAVLLMMALATPSMDQLPGLAGGVLWLGLLLASTRSLDHSLAVELEHQTLDRLVRWPADPVAIYYGKALANLLVLLGVAIVLTPLLIALSDAPLPQHPWMYLGILVAGCAGLAGPGTILAAITTQARGASVLLPLLLFPMVVPVVLAASLATRLVLTGDAMNQADDWLMILGVFDAVFWLLGGLLFSRVVDES